MAAITAVLARYPEQVVTEVTHPATGLPAKKSWLPTVKEVRDACDEINLPILENEARQNGIAEQLAARQSEDAERERRPTVAELKAKYGENWGMTSLDQPKKAPMQAPTIEQLRHHYKHYDLEFKPKTELEEHIDAGFSPSTI